MLVIFLVVGLKLYFGSVVYGGIKWFVCDFMEVLCMEFVMEGINIWIVMIYLVVINIEFLGMIIDEKIVEGMKGFYVVFGILLDCIVEVVVFVFDMFEDIMVNEFIVGLVK